MTFDPATCWHGDNPTTCLECEAERLEAADEAQEREERAFMAQQVDETGWFDP
jgi:hypothetical protein